MEGNNNDSSATTILVTVVIVLVIGLAFYFGFMRGDVGGGDTGANVELNIPTPSGDEESAQ